MNTERRDFGRVRVVWKATLTRLNGEKIIGSTDNVSADGLNVIVAKPLVLGEPVQIDIVTSCRNGLCYFKLDGVTVYSEALDFNLGNAVGLRLVRQVEAYSQLVNSLDASVSVA